MPYLAVEAWTVRDATPGGQHDSRIPPTQGQSSTSRAASRGFSSAPQKTGTKPSHTPWIRARSRTRSRQTTAAPATSRNDIANSRSTAPSPIFRHDRGQGRGYPSVYSPAPSAQVRESGTGSAVSSVRRLSADPLISLCCASCVLSRFVGSGQRRPIQGWSIHEARRIADGACVAPAAVHCVRLIYRRLVVLVSVGKQGTRYG